MRSMSVDNCVVILQTPKVNDIGYEFRITQAQAIDNIYWNDETKDYTNEDGNPKQVISYFGKCEVFTDIQKAWAKAQIESRKVLEDDFCPILEYGIQFIRLPHPFNWYQEKRLTKYKKSSRVKKIK